MRPKHSSSACSGKSAPFFRLAFLVFSLVLPSTLCADTLHFKSGRKLVARIVSETDRHYWVTIAEVELAVPRETIDSIEYGIAVSEVSARVMKQLQRAVHLLENGEREKARLLLEAAIWELDQDIKTVEHPPQILFALRRQLVAAHKEALSLDADARRAEELYQQALEHLNFIRYPEALSLLLEAVKLSPTRLDIQYQLALVAEHLNEIDIAIDAYFAILETDPEPYYSAISIVVLRHLLHQARALTVERRHGEALAYYKRIVMLQAEGDDIPVDFAEFQKRMERRAAQSEAEILLDIFWYADGRDLIDLALASIEEAALLLPDDAEVRQLLAETRFFKKFRMALSEGNIALAAKLKAGEGAALSDSQRVRDKFRLFEGELAPEIEAQMLYDRARAAFERSDYDRAEKLARQVMERFPGLTQAEQAEELLALIVFENHIVATLDRVRAMIPKWRFQTARELLDALLARDQIETSPLHENILALSEQINREMKAEQFWRSAELHLEREEFAEALKTLQTLVRDYPDTQAGKLAAQYLQSNQKHLERRLNLFHRLVYGLVSWVTDLWGAEGDYALAASEEQKRRAWESFDLVVQADLANEKDYRWRSLHIGAPLAIGLVLMIGLIRRYVPRGNAKYRPPVILNREYDENGKPISVAVYEPPPESICRYCCHEVEDGAVKCVRCGQETKLKSVEMVRKDFQRRWGDFNPWDVRTRNIKLDNFEEVFAEARAMRDEAIKNGGDLHPAIRKCQEALRENPLRADAWDFLADLHEMRKKRDKAADCYREKLLICPDDRTDALKLESIRPSHNREELTLSHVHLLLTVSFWWLFFWVSFAFFPLHWVLRLFLCAAFGFLMFKYWERKAPESKLTVEPHGMEFADVHHPIPEKPLTWRDQNRMARLIAGKIREHTGVRAPVLSPWRIFWAVALSLALLVGMIALAWLEHMPWILLGWPAGVVLFAYLLEIHPRAVSAHVLLHHFYEETHSTWADPHVPFQPDAPNRPGKGIPGLLPAYEGEFLITHANEFPLNWALHPRPWRSDRQGVLCSLLQTLNRHWACHRFYQDMKIVRHYQIPMPLGFHRLLACCAALTLFTLGLAVATHYRILREERTYNSAMRSGFGHLTANDAATAEKLFARANELRPHRAAPDLYTAHCRAATGNYEAAEKSFRAALEQGANIAVIHNDFANFLQKHGRLDEARPIYEAALKIDPGNSSILNNLGSLHFKMRRYTKARAVLSDAVDLDPSNATAYVTLGLTCEMLGDIEMARACYEAAVQLAPNHLYSKVARMRLETDLDPRDIFIPPLPSPTA